MSRLHVVRTQILTTAEQIEAVFSQPTLYRLAAVVPYRQPVGRPPLHPAWALLGYGVLGILWCIAKLVFWSEEESLVFGVANVLGLALLGARRTRDHVA